MTLIDRPVQGRPRPPGRDRLAVGLGRPGSGPVPDERRRGPLLPAAARELAEAGEDGLGHRRVGALYLAPTDADLAAIRRRVLERRGSAADTGDVETVAEDRARGLFPALAPGTRAVYVPAPPGSTGAGARRAAPPGGAARARVRTGRAALVHTADGGRSPAPRWTAR
ncbi:hypothetical protein NKH77_25770 [Streptomyces sp. M19]